MNNGRNSVLLSKIRIHKSDCISFFLLLLGAAVTLLPPHFWVTGFLFCAVGTVFFLVPRLRNHRFRRILILLSALCLCAIEIATSIIWVYGAKDSQAGDCTVAVVLGAQVNGRTPSRILRERLDAAVSLAADNPSMILILSGSQGSGEEITEAQAMKEYLTGHGIPSERLLLEEKSTDTMENLYFSMKLAEENRIHPKQICIVTSEFHCARASFLARRLGISARCFPSDTGLWYYRINYYLRELPAFLKAAVHSKPSLD